MDVLDIAPAAAAPLKILIADDSDTDRLILKALLTQMGHQVIAVNNGLDAVAEFRSSRPHLVLMDALMPQMDGIEATRQIKHLAKDAFIPVLFITSLQEADELAHCLDAGGDDFISKPFNQQVLKAKINAFNRMRLMHSTMQQQRDEIARHNGYMVLEQEAAKRVFDKVAHAGCLDDAPNIRYAVSPMSVFHGDVILAGIGPSGNLMLMLGDFTGHGLNAAIGAMPMAQTFYTMLNKGFSIQEVAREVNSKLFEILPAGVFCCAALADLDFARGTLHFWNGGLPDCVLYRPGDQSITRLASTRLPLGIVSGAQFKDTVEVFEIFEGDRLYMWSDGIHEAVNDLGELFGEERLFDLFRKNSDPERLFHEINVSVNSFMAEGPAEDDLSLLEVTVVAPDVLSPPQVSTQIDDANSPKDWEVHYHLRPDSLRCFNPLPLLHYILMQVPSLRSMSGSLYTVLAELYANALEHGVLGLESAIKQLPDGFSQYYQLRETRLAQLNQGEVVISLNFRAARQQDQLVISVKDSGAGFDHRRQRASLEANEALSGRGISLIDRLCDSVSYNDQGNQVSVVFNCRREHSA